MKKNLITGSNGFIGSYFIKKYKDKYDFRTFSFLNDDFESLNINEIDTVLHFAALVHQPKSQQEEFERINVENTVALAIKAKANGVKHFIFMSTIAVYGEDYCILRENLACKPVEFYGQSKLKAELALQALQDDSFTVSIIRPPVVYGYNAPGNIKSLQKLIQKVPILPFGKINNQRSFVYVGNLCAMIEKVIETKKSGIFLASDDQSLSTTKLIELIADTMAKKVYLIQPPLFNQLLKWVKPSLYKRLYQSLEVNNTETKKLLEFENPYTVEVGIRLMQKGEA